MIKPIHVRLRELRVDRDLKEEELARLLGVKQQAYSNYELGKREIPLRHVLKLLDFYMVSADYLLGVPPALNRSYSLGSPYYKSITLNDVLCDLLSLSMRDREIITQYAAFLKMRNNQNQHSQPTGQPR